MTNICVLLEDEDKLMSVVCKVLQISHGFEQEGRLVVLFMLACAFIFAFTSV